MSTHAAPIKIRVGNSLEVEDGSTNVATSQAEAELIKQANIDGKDVAPASVTTTFMSTTDGVFHGAMQSGSVLVGSGGVTITSDVGEGTPTTGICMTGAKMQLIKDSSVVVDLDGTTGDASFLGTVAAGSSIAGTMTAGTIAVGSGGVVISNDGGTSGIYIGGNIMYAKKSGNITFQVDGSTGIVSATKFSLIADATSGVDLTLGNHVFATSITVGTETLGAIQNNATAGAGKATTFAQTSVPTALAAGDLWCDTDDGNKLYRAAAAGANEIKAGEWVAVQDTAYTSKNVTFAQDGIPTSLSAGDLWIDTNDGNKTYRAVAAGANEIKEGEWVAVMDPLTEGNGVATNTSNQITTIDCDGITIRSTASNALCTISSSGITIRSATSGARIEILQSGITCYNSGGTAITTLDANGLTVKNVSSETAPGNAERIRFLNSSGTEEMFAYVGKSLHHAYICGTSSCDLTIGGGCSLDGASASGFTITMHDDANVAVSSGTIRCKHAAYDGSAKADGSFTFYAAATSGGSPTRLHTVTFEDGLIVSWSAA